MAEPETNAAASTGADTDADAGRGYEDARAELVEVVRRLEAGGTTLEESLALWERGERLARACQEWLDGARRRLDEVLESGDDAGDYEGEDEDAGAGLEDDD